LTHDDDNRDYHHNHHHSRAYLIPPDPLILKVDLLDLLNPTVRESHDTAIKVGPLPQQITLALPHDNIAFPVGHLFSTRLFPPEDKGRNGMSMHRHSTDKRLLKDTLDGDKTS